MIKQIKRGHDPDFLLIEPSELVVTAEMRQVIAMSLRDITFHPGPLITLVDGPNFDFLWAERRQLILGQVADADLVTVSRTDRIDNGSEKKIGNTLQPHVQHIGGLSTHENSGLESIWDTVCGAVPTSTPVREVAN